MIVDKIKYVGSWIYGFLYKMDLVYFVICYASTILIVNSYVLLAANLDDFRSIARKFVPKDLADQIVEMAQESGFKYSKHNQKEEETGEYSNESSLSQQDLSYEMTTEAFKKVIHQQQPPQQRFEMKSAPSAPVITLDEIVDKVKQRLYTELINRNAQQVAREERKNIMRLTGVSVVTPVPVPRPVYDYKSPVNDAKADAQYDEGSYEETPETNYQPKAVRPLQYQGSIIQSQPQFVQKPALDKNLLQKKNRYINRQQPGVIKNIRYVPKVKLPTVPSIQLQAQAQPSLMQQKRQQLNRFAIKQKMIMKNKQLVRVTPQAVLQAPPTINQEVVAEVATPENVGGIFEAVDLLKSNDSYEDYVTPAKEEVFESDAADESVTFAPVVLTIKPRIRLPTVPAVAVQELSLAEEIDTKGAIVVPAGDAVEYEYEVTDATTEPKAKTESISYEEREIKPDLNIITTAEVLIKGKVTKKIKMGTMIPTREFYKQSSPNYYAKLPTVAEKYNFNEPIPEADREPENLKPIGNPPASINGKVMLLS